MRLRTVEPAGFDDMAQSGGGGALAQSGAGGVLPRATTPCPGEITFPILRRLAGPGLVVTDDEALQAMVLAFQHLRIVLEPGGAVALAAALFREGLGNTVIAVASGGNVDPAVFRGAMERFG